MSGFFMATDSAQTQYLKDYQPPAYLVEKVDLTFVLAEQGTQVRSRLGFRWNPDGQAGPLVLNGEGLKTLSVQLDGCLLAAEKYVLSDNQLRIDQVPESFELETLVQIAPESNTALEGLYRSSGMFCTQCEAEGFRRITWYPDRPDVMAPFRVRIEADRAQYPVLLSNGNPIEQGELAEGRHYAVWDDPFPKPCYLFALVAGDLAYIEDWHQTPSGRRVRLGIYSEAKHIDQCWHAMASLKKAMAWDEARYGRECDLDVYNIVAVEHFNMGAMENKGLNIFNAKFVLASTETATDTDFLGVEAVIAHEYFHNWTGNRITCRDWFQLSLKEGFTVYRDQEFSADMGSRALKRIEDVRMLRAHQFAEDAGPMAHPVRPQSYEEINNFYTLTVYEKGAELVRMQARLLGEAFRRATDLYFERHDGQAVTTDDFVRCMADASGRDLSQFQHWYDYAGTPKLEISGDYAADRRQYGLTVRQTVPDTPGQSDKPAFHIPLAVGLLDESGKDLLPEGTRLLELRETEQRVLFDDIPSTPTPSLNRGFSAPVKLAFDYSDETLMFLMARDSDGFNRWDAAQILMQRLLLTMVDQHGAGQVMSVPSGFIQAIGQALSDGAAEPGLLAETLSLPSESYLGDQMAVVDVEGIHAARQQLRSVIGHDLRQSWLDLCHGSKAAGDDLSPQAMGNRQLRNLALSYLMAAEDGEALSLCQTQFEQGENMTQVLAALRLLVNSPQADRETALATFEARWCDHPLVMDKWFGVQSSSQLPDTLAVVNKLMVHPAFSLKVPNRLRSVISSFCATPIHFHAADGSGYAFLAEQVRALDALNPQVAARLCRTLAKWRRYDEGRQQQMRQALEGIRAGGELSRDVSEVVSKSLG